MNSPVIKLSDRNGCVTIETKDGQIFQAITIRSLLKDYMHTCILNISFNTCVRLALPLNYTRINIYRYI